MNYKLAKQLKKAGFPQEFKQGIRVCKHNLSIGDGVHGLLYPPCEVKVLAYIPTLSELIEACGDGFYILEHLNGEKVLKWEARSWYDNPPIRTLEKTPKEAVAKLWLKLNDQHKNKNNFSRNGRN